MMSNILPPGLLFLLGALLIPVLKGKLKSAYLVLLPVLGLLNMHAMPHGASWIYQIAGYELILGKVDKLALVFGYVFHIGAFMTMIYMLQVKRDLEYVAGFLYAGAALGVLFAGDLFSFFVFWEMLTIPAALLVFAS